MSRKDERLLWVSLTAMLVAVVIVVWANVGG